jgi:hypothetical protein
MDDADTGTTGQRIARFSLGAIFPVLGARRRIGRAAPNEISEAVNLAHQTAVVAG